MSEESQVIEGYLCACGEKFPTLHEFRRHLFSARARKEPGVHKSRGRVNMATGEITMPPYTERTVEQKRESKYSVKKDRPLGKEEPKTNRLAAQPTDILAQAVQIKFIPRIYTIDYSPILRAAQDAAVKYWGWRPDMPLGNFIDTVTFLYFKEKGITLAGYIVEETKEEKLEREAAIKAREISQEPQEEVPV